MSEVPGDRSAPLPSRRGAPVAEYGRVQATTPTTSRPGVGERIMAVINRDPRAAPHRTRNDAVLAVVLFTGAACLALLTDDGSRPDAAGWALLLAGHAPLVGRRHRPLLTLCLVAVPVAAFHALGYNHSAPVPATMAALYTVATTGTVRRTLTVGSVVIGVGLTMNALTNPEGMIELLRITGWVVAVLFCGIDVRYYRQYVASIVERAERAERTREEEARRRVAEERLRVARDLHDLLAHSITLIGVQTSVAAHVLTADPERLDRASVAKALDDIAETCRSARGELRTTLEVLRAQDAAAVPDARGPLPGLHGLPDLARGARLAGADVDLSVDADDVPPAVGAAVYRITQEALTNVVRHAGPAPSVRVEVRAGPGALRLSVTDDGTGPDPAGTPGFGLVGMRERARSVGGTLDAGPRRGADGFEVTAVLPTPATPRPTPLTPERSA